MTDKVIEQRERGMIFGSHENAPLSQEARATILQAIAEGPSSSVGPLGGRNGISVRNVAPFGRVVIKQYLRGGALRAFVRQRYLRMGAARCAGEFHVLLRALEVGVNVPEPVGYCYTPGLFYKAWLFTRELQGTSTIAELSAVSGQEDRVQAAMEEVVRQVGQLIRAGIFHVDLHPGNTLVDEQGKVYLLDFDKAYTYRGRPNVLRDKYLCRWRRAVIKHDLPELLTELMAHGLRQSFE